MSIRGTRARLRGFTLIEMMIVMAIMAVLLALGAPSIASMMINRRIFGAAEAIQSGLNLARAEALRRNTRVRFTFVSTLDSSCVAQVTGPAWVVSRGAPAGACGTAEALIDDASAPTATDPKTIRRGNVAQTNANNTVVSGSSLVIFDGSGMIAQGTNSGERNGIAYTNNPTTGLPELRIVVDATDGNVTDRRPLWVTVAPSGRVRACDSKVVAASDPRHC